MPKVSFKYGEDIDPVMAIRRVNSVIEQGKISEAGGGPQYCFVTTFLDGVDVIARQKRSAPAADSFIVTRKK